MRPRLLNGLYIFNKPVGISSAGFLNGIKKRFEVSKIGHGGTLDPFASGVLVVGVGREYTKRLSEILNHATKEYDAVIVLGASSSTDDGTGEIEKSACVALPSRAAIQQACDQLQKQTLQVPPRFSAIKISGVRAYAHARRGKDVQLASKDVVLHEYRINDARKKSGGLVEIDVTLIVSSGFYVRSFARDLGDMLGVGGYVEALTRTCVGDFCLNRALELSDVDDGGVVEVRIVWVGRVQGIGFRDFICTTARRHQLAGWVQNMPDGSVEAIAQGTLKDIDAFLQGTNADHLCARIEKANLLFKKPLKTFTGFSVVGFQTTA